MDKSSNNSNHQRGGRGARDQQQQQQSDRFKYNRNNNDHQQRTSNQQRGQLQRAPSQSTNRQQDNMRQWQMPAPAQPQRDQQQQHQHQIYQPSLLDQEADGICQDVQCSIMQGMDSTWNMPLSEHVLYSSYESYDNIMIAQRRALDDMMSRLSECQVNETHHNNSMLAANQSQLAGTTARTDYGAIDNLIDKYDTIRDFSEFMFDRIGQNLDEAEGYTVRDAQLIQATLEAANQNRLSTNRSGSGANRLSTPQQVTKNLSTSSSSSSLVKPPETCSSSSSSSTESNATAQQRQQQQQYRYQQPQSNKMVVGNQPLHQVSQVQSTSSPKRQQQQQPMIKSQFSGYLGKQQYGSSPNQRYAMLENKSISRPQNQFEDKIDNSYRPFEPLIKNKPNADSPLKIYIERDDQGNEHYSHPYEEEIKKFQIKKDLLVLSDPIEPPELNSTPIILVETVKQLEEMCCHIEGRREFAVDVEHHSYRSFQGITCLLQISTRDQDFVIDAIKLRSELYRLNQSFTNPNIVKVFHGADCDILWLQRDFGVYVVNLFDTSRAAKTMKFAHLSLAFLMKHYCNVEPDKSYQLADWRERPLPLPMLQYARADTHYLLYIYDRLRNDILMKGSKNLGADLLKAVFERGREICLKRYEKPAFMETSHLSVLKKSRSTFNAKQMYAFKELYAWRDSISRELDESVGYVLPNNLMIRISEYLPREPQGITALCNPIPPTVKKYLSDIHAIILKAIDVPLDETSKVTTNNQMNLDPSLRSIDLDSINQKQDTAHSAGLQEGSVPSLLDKMYYLTCSNNEDKQQQQHSSDTFIRRQLSNDSNGRNYANNLQTDNNFNQCPSRLYNFLETSWTKSDCQQRNNSAALDDHDALAKSNQIHLHNLQKQFVAPYHRYMARDQNN